MTVRNVDIGNLTTYAERRLVVLRCIAYHQHQTTEVVSTTNRKFSI